MGTDDKRDIELREDIRILLNARNWKWPKPTVIAGYNTEFAKYYPRTQEKQLILTTKFALVIQMDTV